MFSFRAYSRWQVEATHVQSSRFQRAGIHSLKAELSTGRTHLPTAIGHNKEGGEFSPQKTHRLLRRMVLLHGRLQRAHTRDGKAESRIQELGVRIKTKDGFRLIILDSGF